MWIVLTGDNHSPTFKCLHNTQSDLFSNHEDNVQIRKDSLPDACGVLDCHNFPYRFYIP